MERVSLAANEWVSSSYFYKYHKRSCRMVVSRIVDRLVEPKEKEFLKAIDKIRKGFEARESVISSLFDEAKAAGVERGLAPDKIMGYYPLKLELRAEGGFFVLGPVPMMDCGCLSQKTKAYKEACMFAVAERIKRMFRDHSAEVDVCLMCYGGWPIKGVDPTEMFVSITAATNCRYRGIRAYM